MVDSTDAEFSALSTIHAALEPLDDAARRRVLDYTMSRFGVLAGPSNREQGAASGANAFATGHSPGSADRSDKSAFGDFAELFDAAAPTTNSDKVLVAGYWLQVVEEEDSFTSQTINTMLKNLGHPIKNITSAFTELKNRKPADALQLRKSGNSRQARKLFKITANGIKTVESMING